ncbi:MAG: glycosyltransferase family 4 protein [Pirellulales bacterium]
MRIAHVITRLILGGAQENTLLNCEDLLREHGDDVLLVTGPPLGPEGSLLERAAARQVPTEIIPELRRAIHPLRDATAYRHLKKALDKFRPQVVHTHSAKGGILGRAAARALGVPAIVHTVHGAPWHAYQGAASRRFYQACERWAAGRTDAFISVADAMTDLMVAADVAPRDRFTTIYSGMEIEPFLAADDHRAAMRARLGYAPEHVVVGKIARLFHLKGHEYLIAAAEQVVARDPRVRFLLVGDGILRDQLTAEIARRGLADKFCFAGLVPPTEIPAYLGAMDLLVHTSLREGLARTLPQALLAGKPVVSYDIDGAREVVLPGETGYLLPPQSVEPLAGAIVDLAADPALRERLGSAGRERCRQRFDHLHMTREIRRVYERVLGQGRGGRSGEDRARELRI